MMDEVIVITTCIHVFCLLSILYSHIHILQHDPVKYASCQISVFTMVAFLLVESAQSININISTQYRSSFSHTTTSLMLQLQFAGASQLLAAGCSLQCSLFAIVILALICSRARKLTIIDHSNSNSTCDALCLINNSNISCRSFYYVDHARHTSTTYYYYQQWQQQY